MVKRLKVCAGDDARSPLKNGHANGERGMKCHFALVKGSSRKGTENTAV